MRRIAVTVTFAVLATIVAAAVGGAPAGAAVCTKTWANTSSNNVWDQPGVTNGTEPQWNPVGVPIATDVVCLPAGNYTVTIGNGDATSYTIAELQAAAPRFVINPSRALTVTGSTTQTGGTVSVNGTLTSGGYALDAGLLEGTGTITSNITNTAGTFGAGSNLVLGDTFLSHNGSYTQMAAGTYRVRLEGQLNGVNQSHVHTTGSATIAGTIDLQMTEAPSPPADVMIANGGVSGTFSTAIGGPPAWVGILPLGGSVERIVIAPSPSFDDVSLSHVFFPDIEWLASVAITGGFPDGGYHPSAAVTRQSMAAFLYRLAGEPAFTPPGTPSFNDVPDDHPFFLEIEWLADTGVTGGFADGGYHPTASVTRQSMAAFLYRLAGSPAHTPPDDPTFPDVPESNPFYLEIQWLVAMEVTGGFADGGYHPAAAVSRQSMAAFLHRYVNQELPIDV